MRTRLYLPHNGKIKKGENLWVQFLPEHYPDGALRYRAVIRIQRKDYLAFRESKTFTTKRVAEKWIKKR